METAAFSSSLSKRAVADGVFFDAVFISLTSWRRALLSICFCSYNKLYTFLDQLSKRAWLTKIDSSPVPLLKTKQHQDRFFITPNLWWVIGSDSIYSEATKSANLKLSKNASLINSADLIFPAKSLDFDPNIKSGWWKREAVDLVRWRSFLQEKYGIDNQDFDLGGGWAVGEQSIKLKVKSEKFKKEKILLARVMESSRSGVLKFYQNSQEIGSISTKINRDANVRWFEVGRLNSGNELTIASEGDINVINSLAVLDGNEWTKNKNTAKAYQEQGKIVEFNEKNIASDGGSVSYQQINPTKYKVHLSGLTKPIFLVFSQNFNGFWRLNGQSSLPVYSLLNGFRVERDGEYIVEFEPQKYVYPGLVISGLTLAIIVILLLI